MCSAPSNATAGRNSTPHSTRWATRNGACCSTCARKGAASALINKLRAYELQDQGFDTVDANTRLGFAIDARDFGVAAHMLDLLGIKAVRLLTNNPAKVAGLEAEGITVAERLPLALPSNPFKRTLSRHQARPHRASAVIVVDGRAGRLTLGDFSCPCVIGKGGLISSTEKREGDGATPQGDWPVKAVLLRPGRVAPDPLPALPLALDQARRRLERRPRRPGL